MPFRLQDKTHPFIFKDIHSEDQVWSKNCFQDCVNSNNFRVSTRNINDAGENRLGIDVLSSDPLRQLQEIRSASASTRGTLSTTKSTRVGTRRRCFTERLAEAASWTEEDRRDLLPRLACCRDRAENAPRRQRSPHRTPALHGGSFVSSTVTSGASLTSGEGQAGAHRRVITFDPVRRQGGQGIDHSAATHHQLQQQCDNSK